MTQVEESKTPTARRRRGAIALPALVAGLGLAFSVPPWGFWVLAFPASGLLFWRLDGLPARARLWAGWLAGLGCLVPGLMWLRSFSVPGGIVLILMEAFLLALGAWATCPGPKWARAASYVGAMTMAEALRDHWPFGGLPIGGIFLGQAESPLLGVARVAGPLGITALIHLTGVALVALLFALRHRDGDGSWLRLGSVALGVTILIAAFGAVAPDGGPPVRSVTAALIQGGGKRGFRKAQVDPATVLAAQFAATQQLQRRDGRHLPELVVWPEDVVSLNEPLGQSPEEGVLSVTAANLKTTLVVGVTENETPATFRNEVVAWGPDGQLAGRFEKVHRVPFGEYVPYRGFFAHLGNLSAVPRDAIPGTASGLITTPAGPLGVMVSYEVFYADRGRSSVRAGAELLVVPTNTSSYSTAQVPTQEVAADQIQAVEQGRDLLQAAPTGYSTVVNHRGELLQRSVLGGRQVLQATVDERRGHTIYVNWGDNPVLVLAGIAVATSWLWRRRSQS